MSLDRAFSVSGLVVLLAMAPAAVAGQTGQLISLQGSVLGSVPFSGGLSSVDPGIGFEAQLRWNPSAFSLGGGFEYSKHDIENTDRTVQLTGVFVEPRYVIDTGSDNMAPYVSGRLAVSQTKFETEGLSDTASGFTANAGGGLLFRLGPRTNLDVGATVGAKELGETTIPTTPEPTVFDLGSGANVIFRVGLAVGLGG